MRNIIVVSFTDEAKAIEAMHKLTELDSYGDISIYEKIMIRKNANGESEVLKEDSFEGWRTLTGMSIGGMLGLLGGPVGFVIGLYSGTAIGAIGDLNHYDFADDFITRTEDKLKPGTVSIIAEIDEDSSAFIDISLKPYDAVISRTDVDFEFDNYVNQEIDEIEDEIAEERAALKKAIGDDKIEIQNKIAALKEKRKATIAKFEANAQATGKSISDKTTGAFGKVKSNVTEFTNSISNELNDEKAARIKSKMAKHENKLKELKKKLGELTPGVGQRD